MLFLKCCEISDPCSCPVTSPPMIMMREKEDSHNKDDPSHLQYKYLLKKKVKFITVPLVSSYLVYHL